MRVPEGLVGDGECARATNWGILSSDDSFHPLPATLPRCA